MFYLYLFTIYFECLVTLPISRSIQAIKQHKHSLAWNATYAKPIAIEAVTPENFRIQSFTSAIDPKFYLK